MLKKIKSYSIYFDGKCFICKQYIEKIEKAFIDKPNLHLYNIREKQYYEQLMDISKRRNKHINPEEGLILIIDHEMFQGEDAIRQLNNLVIKNGFLLNLISKISANPFTLNIAYKVIKIIRLIILQVKNLKKFM